MKQNRNSRRVNEQAREKLANILLFEISDPDLALVTVTGVEVSVDKSFMSAFFTCDAERYDEVEAALGRARGRIRSLLGRTGLQKPVTVVMEDGIATVTVHLTVVYGSKVMPLCEKVQENVKQTIQNMTGITVSRVDVLVVGLTDAAEKE